MWLDVNIVPTGSFPGVMSQTNMVMSTSMASAARHVFNQDFEVFQLSEITNQHIFASVKQSLERLQLDYIDLLQCMSSHQYARRFPYSLFTCRP
jgi:aryl-alcohol dehydrogenase-like predicted oxidoreductase